jgi:hypothetical protein
MTIQEVNYKTQVLYGPKDLRLVTIPNPTVTLKVPAETLVPDHPHYLNPFTLRSPSRNQIYHPLRLRPALLHPLPQW